MTRAGGYSKDGIRRVRSAEVQEASVLRSALEVADFTPKTLAHREAGWAVHAVEWCMEGVVYIDPRRYVIVLSITTWATLCYSDLACSDIVQMARNGATGIRFLPMDTGAFAEAVARQARKQPILSEQDMLAALEEDVRRLLTQVSGVNSQLAHPDILQTQLLMQNLTDLQRRAVAFHDRLDRVSALLDAAAEAVIGATS